MPLLWTAAIVYHGRSLIELHFRLLGVANEPEGSSFYLQTVSDARAGNRSNAGHCCIDSSGG